jgi:hypothetical protein
MNRRTGVLVLVVSVLVVTAGAGAYTGSQLVLGGSHTTTSDFDNAQTLKNVSVSNGNVSLTESIENFEDNDITIEQTDYTGWSGDTGSFQAQTGTVLAGSYSGELTSSNQFSGVTATADSAQTTSISALIQIKSQTGSDSDYSGFLINRPDGTQFARVEFEGDGDIMVATTPSDANIGSWSIGTKYNVTIDFDFANNQYTVILNGTSHGPYDNNQGQPASGWSEYTLGSYTGGSGGSVNTYYDDIQANPGTTPTGQYVGTNHTAEYTEQGWTNITILNNASVSVKWHEGDGTLLSSSTYTTTGNKTQTWTPSSATKAYPNVTVTATGSDPKFTLSDEGVLFENDAPTVDNTSATPTGDLNVAQNDFTIDVNDSGFSLTQGDTVTADLYVDGSLQGSDTLTSNGTASVTATVSTGGSHTYHWDVNDSYGGETTSQTFTISSPSELEIHQESNPDQLVTNAQVNITAYYGSEVLRRNTSNGKVDLAGFPIDEPIIVRVQADGYYTRTAVIEDIYQQSTMYILNDSIAAHEIRFDLQDPTGDYPKSDTVLFVERDLNVSGNVSWKIIAGDNFGIKGVPVDLEQDERYRIRIKNLDTDTAAVLGSYTAIQSETVTLSPESVTLNVTELNQTYGWNVTQNNDAQKIIFEYLDTETQTQSIKFNIHERFNKSNVLINNQTFSSNDLVYQTSLTASELNTSWTAELYIDRGDGYKHYRVPIGGGPRDIIPGILDTVWRNATGVFIMLVVALAFSQLNVGVGAITTSAVGGLLWYIGLLNDISTAPAIVLALGISLVYHYRTGGGKQ